MKDDLKGKCFRDLAMLDVFQAELALEDEVRTSTLSKLMTLNLNDQTVALEYARLRGMLEALKMLQSQRVLLLEQSRNTSSQTNS